MHAQTHSASHPTCSAANPEQSLPIKKRRGKEVGGEYGQMNVPWTGRLTGNPIMDFLHNHRSSFDDVSRAFWSAARNVNRQVGRRRK